ncbi:MAG: hypothetical protein FJ112_09000 [Deltaproteobacteria bacterium]|nr:hypothetical protein [Deltaproteobacteria bacterium]
MIQKRPYRVGNRLLLCVFALSLSRESQTSVSNPYHARDSQSQNQNPNHEINISFENSELQQKIHELFEKITELEKHLAKNPFSSNDTDKIMGSLKELLEQLEALSNSMKLNSDKVAESDRELFTETLTKIKIQHDIFQSVKDSLNKIESKFETLEKQKQAEKLNVRPTDVTTFPVPSHKTFDSSANTNSFFSKGSSKNNQTNLISTRLLPASTRQLSPESNEQPRNIDKTTLKTLNTNGIYNPPEEGIPIQLSLQRNPIKTELTDPNRRIQSSPQVIIKGKINQDLVVESPTVPLDTKKNLAYSTPNKFIEDAIQPKRQAETPYIPIAEPYVVTQIAKNPTFNAQTQYSFNSDGTWSAVTESQNKTQRSISLVSNAALAAIEFSAEDNPKYESITTIPKSVKKKKEEQLVRQILASSEFAPTSEILGLLNKPTKAIRRPVKRTNSIPITTISSAPPLITRVLSLLGF